ncbi:MAG: hypothetical protein KatS3mg003_1608 [Candidatus Nitrosocaldaceae archaeon]|nr:MAG: hypothetical protein KatS3mg003_0459 [Candidatus Nitrosocaldaceae archaeon]GIU72129.1 MAG: hypothetical protein KatS3mg003_1608 [Candidatus Nitrosocaldaceae archaeon]
MKGIVALDMDGTILNGRTVFALAKLKNVMEQIKSIMNSNEYGYIKTEKIARFWEGLSKEDILDAVDKIQLNYGAEELVNELKKDYRVGIISDSYTLVTEYIAKKLGGLDFTYANDLVMNNDIVTGEVRMPLGWEKINCYCKISVCKRYHLEKAMKEYNLNYSIAVGDTNADRCMIETANIGIAFDPKDDIIRSTDKIINDKNLLKVLDYL